MIQANELRIGNYVLFDSNIDRIISIGVKSVNAEYKSMWNYDRLHGIPLTPEILKKCGGFNPIKSNTHFWQIGNCLFLEANNDGKYYLCSVTSIVLPNIIAENLHTLQNIMALTGEELEVNL